MRQLFILFFVLLQSMAPLLHAHAMPSGHGGLHMPVEIQLVAGDESGPAWQTAQQVPEEMAIGVAGSIQPRHECSCGAGAALPPAALAPADRALGVDQIHPSDRWLPFQATRLLPYPCAPPLV